MPVEPGRWLKVSSTFFWKMSWAQNRPKGGHRKLYLPWDELKVVCKELVWSSLIVQYALLASTMEKYLAPLNLGSTSSNVGVQCCGRLMSRLRSLGSRHSWSVSLLFVTQTNVFTQSVGSSTLAMIPCSMSASSSFLRGSRSASGNKRGGWITGGTVGPRVIWNSPWKPPVPWKQFWYWRRSSDFASVIPCGSGVVAALVYVVAIA